MFDYPVFLESDPETGAVVASFPDLPFCHSVGIDADEASMKGNQW